MVSRRSAHNVLLFGSPGTGKLMMARRLTTIVPAMTLAEAIETTRIHRVAGLTGDHTALVTTRPFRVPHHTISDVGLIGGNFVKTGPYLSWPQAFSYPCMVRLGTFFTNSSVGRHCRRAGVAGASAFAVSG